MDKKPVVMTLLLLLVGLTGCVGESESNGLHQTSANTIKLEIINDCQSVEIEILTATLSNGSILETTVGVNVTLYHSIYSSDVTQVAFGYDLNLDGTIDFYDNSSKGINTLSIPISEFVSLGQQTFLTTIAGVATSSDGISTQLIHLSNDCGALSNVNLAQLNLYTEDFSMYDFSVTDASGTLSTDAGQDLVYVAMDAGEDLSWATVIVQLSADGGAYTECTNPGKATDTGCAVSDSTDDGKWGFSEEITISEGSDDLCSTACTVQVKVLDAASNKLIYESTETSVN